MECWKLNIILINQRLSLTLVFVEIKYLSDKGSKSVIWYQCSQTCSMHYHKKITFSHQVIILELKKYLNHSNNKNTQEHTLCATLTYNTHDYYNLLRKWFGIMKTNMLL